jgi:uncharacterized protein YjbK
LVEKELKYELTKAHYLKLIKVLKPRKNQSLVNYYFDDPDLQLRKKKFALRIRIVSGGKAYFTLKYPGKTPEKAPAWFKVRREHEVAIPAATAKQLLRKKIHILDIDLEPVRILRRSFSKKSLANIQPLGLIETRRSVVAFKRSLALEIDSCKIYNKKFYELEIETEKPNQTDRDVKTLLKKYDIPYAPISRSKFGRFIEEWKKRNK